MIRACRLFVCLFVILFFGLPGRISLAAGDVGSQHGSDFASGYELQPLHLRERLQLEVLGQTSRLQVRSSTVQVSGQALKASVNYYPFKKLAIEAGYHLFPSVNGETSMTGIDTGIKWFVASPGAAVSITSNRHKLRMYSHWTHYLALGHRSRTINGGGKQLGYSGFSYGYGCNWYVGRQFGWSSAYNSLLNIEVSREELAAESRGHLGILNIALGLGQRI